MFINFALKKTQVWVTMALLLLSFSVCPHSSYPHAAEEDEDPTDEEGNPEGHEESQQLAPNEDNGLEEEETEEEAVEDVENDTKKPCFITGAVCTDTAECCESTSPGWIVECWSSQCLQTSPKRKEKA